LRLPFHLICAQNVFQRKVDETFGDLAGVTGIADDIVVYGYKSDFSDHDENLCAVLQRAQETGLRFNLDKYKFRSDCPVHLHAYWNYCDKLTVADGLILKGTRIVIPKSLQPDIMQQLHDAHQGAEKSKLKVKGSVFWANINKDIDELVKG